MKTTRAGTPHAASDNHRDRRSLAPYPVVLYVEDSSADAMMMREGIGLARVGCALAIARDGIEALDYLRRTDPQKAAPRPSLIVLDLNMPRMDGHELLEALKADPDLAPIPVFVLSTSRSEDDVERALGAGARRFMSKPDDLDEYLALIGEIADTLRLERY